MQTYCFVPFGKFQGAEVDELPSQYLLWITSQAFVKTKYPDLLRALLIEIEVRANSGQLYDDLYV
jgi:uncharacterized protein (DUF3820 family)